jgi:formylglycine-generating enzyme required for sulfatase activity
VKLGFLTALLLLAQGTPAAAAPDRVPGTVFEDCQECPEMVVIPAGKYTMGAGASQQSWAIAHGATPESVANEVPQRRVSVLSFALGEYDVTVRQYAAFVQDSGYASAAGCRWDTPGFAQSQLDPVVCVSWKDAQAYVAWLNQKAGSTPNGGPYRLPTEAEWEYAARAGTSGLFWWGDDPKMAAEHAWYAENAGGHTQPVGMKTANDFVVFDIAGNVWQWTQNCYAENFQTSAATTQTNADCPHAGRGGSWSSELWMLRTSTREQHPAEYRDGTMGFRVARDL